MITSLPYWVLFHSKDFFTTSVAQLCGCFCHSPCPFMWAAQGKKGKAEVCHFSAVTNPSESIASWNITVLSWGNLVFLYLEMFIINSLMILSPLLLCHTSLDLCEISQGCSSSLSAGQSQADWTGCSTLLMSSHMRLMWIWLFYWKQT